MSIFGKLNYYSLVISGFTIPFEQIKPFINLRISDLFLLFALLFAFIDIFMGKKVSKNRINSFPFFIPSIFILIGGILSSFGPYNSNIARSLLELLKAIFVFLSLPFLYSYSFITQEQKYTILKSFVLGIAISCSIAIIDKNFSTNIGPLFNMNSAQIPGYGHAGRYRGVTNHPNSQGLLAALGIPLNIGFLLYYRKRITKWFGFAFLSIITFYGLLLSGSVSALMSFVFYIFTFVILHKFMIGKPKKNLISAIALLIVFLAIIFLSFLFISNNNINKIIEPILVSLNQNPNFSRVINTTFRLRLLANQFAINEFLNHPFIGYGMDVRYQTLSPPFVDFEGSTSVHNTILLSTLGGGVFVGIGYILIYVISSTIMVKAIQKWDNGFNNPVFVFLSLSILIFIFFDMAQSNTHVRISWMFVSIVYSWSKDVELSLGSR